MADEQKKRGEGADDDLFGSDSGLGNLPPLSDFDSASGVSSDSGLPPLGSLDRGASSDGGLPPLGDIGIETPRPTGGNIKPSPPDFDTGTEVFSSGSPFRSSGSGFQDLAADSDFSPETPEIGPGPESDVDTPMFDSAFGGGSAFDAAVQTPAPTQAMETPLFGAGGGGSAFDAGAFGGGGGTPFGGGTPMPDFSPDTGIGMEQVGVGMAGAGASTAAPPPRGSSTGSLILGFLLGAVIALIGGIIAGPYVLPKLPMIPEMLPPTQKDVQITQLKSTVAQKQKQIDDFIKNPPTTQLTLSEDQLNDLIKQIQEKNAELQTVQANLDSEGAKYAKLVEDKRQIEDDIATLNAQYMQTEEEYQALRNETSIMQARQKGLIAEVDRLTGLVGNLEEATERSNATRAALAFAVDRLYIQVKEGIPLTPEQFSRDSRIAAVEQLREQVQQAPYVTAELQNAYTDLYLQELRIASTEAYFFARIIVTDKYGAKYTKWAECLSKGNWGVYYRTLDGTNIGSFENTGTAETPQWSYRENLPNDVKKQIESDIIASRTEGFEEKVSVLAEKQIELQEGTPLQRAFDSL